MEKTATEAGPGIETAKSRGASRDKLDLAWFFDKAIYIIVFIGGISAIIFIIAIFVFVTREGIGFIRERL